MHPQLIQAPTRTRSSRSTPLAQCAGTTAEALLDLTIGDAFDRTVARFGDRDALIVLHQRVRLTYRQLGERVDTLARGLIAAGIGAGDRVGMWSPNNAEWVELQYAAAKVGAILVNINPAYRADELRYALRHSGCRLLVTATGFKSGDYRAMLAEVQPDLPDLDRVVFLGTSDWDDLVAGADGVSAAELRARAAALAPDDPINIQYTSGTTGAPKGATLSHRNILNNGHFTGRALGYGPDDRVCIPVPFYHCFGMVVGSLACVSHGAAMVVPAPSFDTFETLWAIEQERCTAVLGVPTMFIDMLGHRELARFDLSSLRTGMMGGAPCPEAVMRRCIEMMHLNEITIGYGMTET
jgi:fatty-acyl-CoA synthase